MRKVKLLTILSLILLFSCQKNEINCNEFCAIPERHEIFKSFDIEKQFKYFRACPCWGDSISEKHLFGQEIGQNEQIVDFLVNKLSTEDDAEILIESLELLNFLGNREELKGREDVLKLVDETVNRIPEKDERDLIDKILGDEPRSRKQRLNKLAKEIEMRIMQASL